MLCFKCSRNTSADYNSESTAFISFISEIATVKDAALFIMQKTAGCHQPEALIKGIDVNAQAVVLWLSGCSLDRVSLEEALQKTAGTRLSPNLPS